MPSRSRGGSAFLGGKQSHQRGVALILVLGMVALIAGWAATAAYGDMVSLRRAENLNNSVRAMLAAESGIELAKLVLMQDVSDSKTDNLSETWASTTPPFPIDDGMIIGSITDANRFFNLNDLVDDTGRVRPKAVEIAKRLFTSLEIDSRLVDALVDWMDRDDLPTAGGAEQDSYFDRPYRIKNSRMDRLEELKMVIGFDSKVFDKLQGSVIVRPPLAGGVTPININTASAVVLAALFPNMSEQAAAQIVADRDDTPFTDSASLINSPSGKGVDSARVTVVSDAFVVRSHAEFASVRWNEEQLLARQGKRFTLIYRQQEGWNL
ncbi:MAG: type II secretion system minor pseudopilin GspK [Mariprofundales bacterium]|nr:type II secretion system minor pseudopilin GspK [Mariprofundales bacterium]